VFILSENYFERERFQGEKLEENGASAARPF
jgi:hypothetical protein